MLKLMTSICHLLHTSVYLMCVFSYSYVSAGYLFTKHDYIGTGRELSVHYHIMALLQFPGKDV